MIVYECYGFSHRHSGAKNGQLKKDTWMKAPGSSSSNNHTLLKSVKAQCPHFDTMNKK